jgi:hypothetical protein
VRVVVHERDGEPARARERKDLLEWVDQSSLSGDW